MEVYPLVMINISVVLMENPNQKWMMAGGTPISGNPQIMASITKLLVITIPFHFSCRAIDKHDCKSQDLTSLNP